MLVLLAAAALVVACGRENEAPPVDRSIGVRTATPSPTATVQQPDLNRVTEAFAMALPSPTPTPTLAPPAPAPPSNVAAAAAGFSWANDPACLAHPDRFNWQKYALAAGFPEQVVSGEEMATVIRKESEGDLCAVNRTSGATCWIQQVPGGPQYFDPHACMSIGFAKWQDGGDSFERHWYRWWR